MKLYDDCPGNAHCGPWREGIDVRLCVRCGSEIPDADGLDRRPGTVAHHPAEDRPNGVPR